MGSELRLKTSLYVDGFNVYYACFKRNRLACEPLDKWLNYRLLAHHLMAPDDTLHQVHYFTARVHRSTIDPDQNIRQETYFRALRTVPSLFIHYGSHIPVTRRGMLIQPDAASLGLWPRERVEIATFEEKGPDVALATKLLEDSYEGAIEHAIILSNDTDLIAPIRSARRRIRVSVVSPDRSVAKHLHKYADAAWSIDYSVLRSCRFPIPVITHDGAEIYPPLSWQAKTWMIRELDE